MADIKDWGAFVRGRWDWTRHGYESGFPRNCQFTDVDAAVEFDGHELVIETKSWDGLGIIPSILSEADTGQRRYLRQQAALGKTVLVVYGCGACNDPYAMHQLGARKDDDRFADWRDLDRPTRRKHLKREIDTAMGLAD